MITDNAKPGPEEAKAKPSGRKGERALILALATGHSIPQAAKKAGVCHKVAYKRMEDPKFREKVYQAREAIIGEVVGKLTEAGCQAVKTLVRLLNSKSEGTRVKCALGILSNLIRGHDALNPSRGKVEVRGSMGLGFDWDKLWQTMTGNTPAPEKVEEEMARLLDQPALTNGDAHE